MTEILPKNLRKQLKIRKMLIPDKGHFLLDCDLAGADAQVVAWDCEDEILKKRFRAGARIHLENARDLYGPTVVGPLWDKENPREYWAFKTAVHGTNYGAAARTTAISVGWKIEFAQKFQAKWFSLHPNIKNWHQDTQHKLNSTRTITNKFGYRRIFFSSGDFTNALAWIPQSTVAIVTDRGAQRVSKYLPWVTILVQVHDSLVMQVPYHRLDLPKLKKEMSEILENPVPYADPLTIPWGFSYSTTSWGELKEWSK